MNTRLLRDLQVDSQILDLIQDEFLKLLYERSIKVHTFQEGRGLSGVQGFTGKVNNFGLPHFVSQYLLTG